MSACANDARGNEEFAAANLFTLESSPAYTQEPTSTATWEPTATFTPQPTLTPEPTSTPEPTAIPRKVVAAPSIVESAPVQVNPVENVSESGASFLINEINRIRVQNGVGSLSVDPYLMRFASSKSIDMATRLYFSHVDSQGRQMYVDSMLANCNNPLMGANWAAENLGRNNHPNPIGTVILSWMNSPEHAYNLVDPAWKTIGVGMAVGSDGRTYFSFLAAKGPCVI